MTHYYTFLNYVIEKKKSTIRNYFRVMVYALGTHYFFFFLDFMYSDDTIYTFY